MIVGVPGIVCADRGHSFTSSLDYQITEDQFRAIKYFADEKRSNPPEWYLFTYNCVDFATQAARTGGIEPPSSGWFVFTPAELEQNILRAPQEYEECLSIELERPGGVPSEEERMEAIKKCSEETGYPAPNISEEEAFEYIEDVRGKRLEPEVEEEPSNASLPPGGVPAEEVAPQNAPDAGVPRDASLPGGVPTKETAPEESPSTVKKPPRKKYCLTFDDGPHPGTEDVLNALGIIRATFFLLGNMMEKKQPKQAELLARMLVEGHKIGNHTFTHLPYKKSEYEALIKEPKEKQEKTIKEKGFQQNLIYFTELFNKYKIGSENIEKFPGFTLARLPGSGKSFPKFVKMVEEMGMKHVGWDFEYAPSGKMGAPTHYPVKGVKNVEGEFNRCPRDKDILLLHDPHWQGKQSVLKSLLDKLQASEGEGSCNTEFGLLDESGKCK